MDFVRPSAPPPSLLSSFKLLTQSFARRKLVLVLHTFIPSLFRAPGCCTLLYTTQPSLTYQFRISSGGPCPREQFSIQHSHHVSLPTHHKTPSLGCQFSPTISSKLTSNTSHYLHLIPLPSTAPASLVPYYHCIPQGRTKGRLKHKCYISHPSPHLRVTVSVTRRGSTSPCLSQEPLPSAPSALRSRCHPAQQAPELDRSTANRFQHRLHSCRPRTSWRTTRLTSTPCLPCPRFRTIRAHRGRP